jgi:hypothetical protein
MVNHLSNFHFNFTVHLALVAAKRGLTAEEAQRFHIRVVCARPKAKRPKSSFTSHKEGWEVGWRLFVGDQHELSWLPEYLTHPFSMGDVVMYDPLAILQNEERSPWFDGLLQCWK